MPGRPAGREEGKSVSSSFRPWRPGDGRPAKPAEGDRPGRGYSSSWTRRSSQKSPAPARKFLQQGGFSGERARSSGEGGFVGAGGRGVWGYGGVGSFDKGRLRRCGEAVPRTVATRRTSPNPS